MRKQSRALPLKSSIPAVLLIILAACSAQEATPTLAPTDTVEPTDTAVPTLTPASTATPTRSPTATPQAVESPGIQRPEVESITGIEWRWLAFQDTGTGEDIEVDEPAKYTLTLHSNSTAAIQADCNQVTLGYVLEENDIYFSATGPATNAFCGEDSLDQQYLALLDEAVTWFVDDQDRLVLELTFDSGNLLFEAGEALQLPSGRPETVEPDIIGTLWEWQAFQDTAELNDITVEEPAQYTLFLEPGGRAAVQADCNQLSWDYSLEGSSITFDDTGPSTLAFCGEESLDQRYLELLSNVVEWILLEDGALYLNLWADGGSMVFSPSLESISETACPTSWFMGETASLQGITELPVPDACPEGPPLYTFAAAQPFENGRMIWLEEPDSFYILFNEGARPDDSRQTFITLGPLKFKPNASVNNRIGDEPPPDLIEPVSGFGLIWRNEVEGQDLDIRSALGWALGPELGFDAALQCQEQQTYAERICYVLDVNGNLIVLSAHAVAGDIWWEIEGN